MDKVEVGKDYIRFLLDDESYSPEAEREGSLMTVGSSMGGFLHMAAIPKEYLKDCDLSEMYAIYPKSIFDDGGE